MIRVYTNVEDGSATGGRDIPNERDRKLDLLANVARRTLLAILTHRIAVPVEQMTRFSIRGPISNRNSTNQQSHGRTASPFSSPAKLRTMAQTVYLLNVVHGIVLTGKQVTQRELFYRTLGGGSNAPVFVEQTQFNKALFTLMEALGCERHELGIFTTARGFAAADPEFETICLDQEGNFLFDLSAHPDGLSISEQLTCFCTIQTNAVCVLVVEKDTVFQSLVSTAKFFQTVPCILVTARGYPDNMTIRFLNRLRVVVGSSLPFVYLGDLDPHGICIYLTYWRALNEGIQWIGVHYEDIGLDYNQHSLLGLKLKPSDASLLKSLLEREGVPDLVKDQLKRIKERGLKYEVECLHSMGESFIATEWLPSKLQSVLSNQCNQSN